MNFLMTIIVVMLFIGIPIVKYLERKAISTKTGEKILLELKEKTKKLKVILYILFAVIVLFAPITKEITLYLALMKVLFIVGLYLAEAQLKTRIYLTNKSVYMVTRMAEKKLLSMKRFKKSQLYRIDLVPNQSGIYRLFFNGEKNFLSTMDISIAKKDDLLLFRKMVKKNLDIYINEPIEVEEVATSNENKIVNMDKLTKYFLTMIGLFVAVALLKEIVFSEDEKSFGQMVSSVIAFQFIPFMMYICSYVYLKVSGKTAAIQHTKIKKSEWLLVYVLGATALPFVVLTNHGIADGERFIIVHIIGFIIIAMMSVMAWITGKLSKYAVDKQIMSRIEDVIRKTREKKNA